jgi:hypothetical protein
MTLILLLGGFTIYHKGRGTCGPIYFCLFACHVYHHTIATINLDYIITMTLDHNVAVMHLGTIVAFDILLVALMISSPMM